MIRFAVGWVLLALCVTSSAAGAASAGAGPAGNGTLLEVPVVFPEHPVDQEDAYLCTAVELPDQPLKLVGIESTSDQKIVHHMLLFGCNKPAHQDQVWDCRMASACGGGSESVLYGWGKNAPAIKLPDGVGFSVGKGSSIQTVVLQMHYLKGRPANDTSGVRLRFSTEPVPYSAGMLAYASSFTVPPGKPSHLVPNQCCYSGWEPLHGFATRVHTHALGRLVSLDRSRPANRSALERITAVDPQKPQGFYPVEETTFLPGDMLAMACDFNSKDMKHAVHAGVTHSDEMCNLYLMLYSQLPFFQWCLDSRGWSELNGPGGMPDQGILVPETQVWKPPATIKAAAAEQGPTTPLRQVAGVASTGDGTLWLFHRGDRAWTGSSFGADNKFQETKPIAGPMVLQVDQDSGEVLRSWGAGKFLLPHMITVDYDGNVWVTDVGLHQAIKFSAEGKQLLALGKKGQPGSGKDQFCKPTQVAVARDGSVFVADGYCNSRVAQFSANGTWVRDITLPQGGPQMDTPHSVLVHECLQQLIVADREGGKVHTFQLPAGSYLGSWDLRGNEPDYGLPYALTMGPYGTVLALTWQRDAAQPKVWLVALHNEVGDFEGHWEVPGVQVPHDLALAPAPLQITGAGERTLAVLVSETRPKGDSSNAIQKFLFSQQGDSQVENAEMAAALAGAAAHAKGTGHGAHAGHGEPAADEDEEDLEEGQQSAAAAATKKQGGSYAAVSQQQQQAEEEVVSADGTHVGHGLVKPVEGSNATASSSSATAAQQTAAAAAAAAAAAEEGDEGYGKQATSATAVGHGMVKPVGEASGSGSGVDNTGAPSAAKAELGKAGPQGGTASPQPETKAQGQGQQQQQGQGQQPKQPQQAGPGPSDREYDADEDFFDEAKAAASSAAAQPQQPAKQPAKQPQQPAKQAGQQGGRPAGDDEDDDGDLFDDDTSAGATSASPPPPRMVDEEKERAAHVHESGSSSSGEQGWEWQAPEGTLEVDPEQGQHQPKPTRPQPQPAKQQPQLPASSAKQPEEAEHAELLDATEDDYGLAAEQEALAEEQQAAAAAAAAEERSSAGGGSGGDDDWGHEEHQHGSSGIPGYSSSLFQPWLLGIVFVSVALVSWNRLRHWRRRGGAGYRHPAHHSHLHE